MSKKVTVGQRVKFNQPYSNDIKVGDVGTVREVDNDHVGIDMETGRRAGRVAYCYAHRLDSVSDVPKFKVGDLVTPNGRESDTTSFTAGKPYKVTDYAYERRGIVATVFLEADDKGCQSRFRPASYYDHYVEQKQPEPMTEFRIRKHGTALREVRGIPFDSQEAAEQAVSRYTPGSVYEIVEVKVVRTVKVEQEVRVIDYKEAA